MLAGNIAVTVTPGIDLVSTSAVVASLQGSAGGTTTVHRCVVNTTTNTFTNYLTKAATQIVKVAWIVLEIAGGPDAARRACGERPGHFTTDASRHGWQDGPA